MQNATGSYRSIQRRSPVDPGPPPSIPVRSMSPGNVSQPRNSSASIKSNHSSSSRRQNVGQSSQGKEPTPLSQIEKSVTHLLVATKQLLESLTKWSRGESTDTQVSDVYVRLGYEFNIACRAFQAIKVDTDDLGNVPEDLRGILEKTLSQDANVASLERYLPKIRDIIIHLLHGLKRKQQKLRHKSREQNGEQSLPRTSSVASTSSYSSNGTGLTTLLDQGISSSGKFFQMDGADMDRTNSNTAVPPRGASSATRNGLPRDQSRASVSSNQSTLSSTTMQSMPVLPPYPGDEVPLPNRPGSDDFNVDNFPSPPPPPKEQQNALAALQRGGDLERRASRRYSAYQISKHLGAPSNGVPMLPLPQNAPLPSRSRNDARESMRAVQTRGERHMRLNSNRLNREMSPARVPRRISEEPSDPPTAPRHAEPVRTRTPTENLPADRFKQPPTEFGPLSANLKGASADVFSTPTAEVPTDSRVEKRPQTPQHKTPFAARSSPPQNRQFTPDDSLQANKELTVFLQYKTKVKKFVLVDGYNDLSLARLQLAFIEKFAWNTHNNGMDLPEIYLQDPVSGVRHELEDLNDIKGRSLLVLNVEPLDEVKRHIDQGLGGLKKMVEGLKTALDDQQATIQRVSDRQKDAAKEMVRISAVPIASSRMSYMESPRVNGSSQNSKVNSQAQITEVQSLRRDLAVLRQTVSGFQSDIKSSMSSVSTKASFVKSISIKASIPDVEGSSGRAYVEGGKKSLNEDSERLVEEVEDLQDVVEDLRKDVVTRGVRPLPRQLESVAKDIAQANVELKKMQDFIKRERPIWTKVWEKELELVCLDREDFTSLEEIAKDLQDDLEKASQTFSLVEQATKEQLKDALGATGSGRVLSRGLNHVATADPTVAKEGVLGEVRALQPNHENRLEAIERAEKVRQKELESRRGGEFQKELGDFVEEGKLKKSGGFEEVERARKAKDERIRREVWERQNGITQADASQPENESALTEEIDNAEEPSEEVAEGDAVLAEV